ncbi:hypothetical protein B0T17DRAFT_503106 [Bombardia bombarda]|uniref:Uncharacterized protein n=1 Tax=Bombardia bombarda TaxID=252184 RepID=A0AA40CEJ8_9PEZI|nr:hypothetical protein B0T17DRAFT_503106 [Bombardia bombarda]
MTERKEKEDTASSAKCLMFCLAFGCVLHSSKKDRKKRHRGANNTWDARYLTGESCLCIPVLDVGEKTWRAGMEIFLPVGHYNACLDWTWGLLGVTLGVLGGT